MRELLALCGFDEQESTAYSPAFCRSSPAWV